MEKPDDEEIQTAIDNAFSGINQAGSSQELQAQILQTQRLLYDLEETNETMGELNENLERYTFWSRLLTVALVVVGVLSLLAQIGVL